MVDFKLHLSSKSLCWQSGFVTWEEGDMAELKRPEPPLDIPFIDGLFFSNFLFQLLTNF